MFGFQPSSLRISNDVTYDVSNNVSNLVYQIPTSKTQGK
jgi:hypothetical protein